MNQCKLHVCKPIAIMIPSIAIGSLIMYWNQVPAMIWIQNILCFLLASIVACVVIKHKSSARTRENKAIVLIPLFFLILTFLSPGIEGVHRWISLGSLRFNVAIIVMPIILIEIGRILLRNELKFAVIITAAVILTLVFQPDASQVTGFTIPVLMLLSSKIANTRLRVLLTGIAAIPIVLSWVYLDKLPPVEYVERIVWMAANEGVVWMSLGIVSLILLPLPFLFFPPDNGVLISRCIGLYYIIIIASTFLGNFPVPLMGYGMSPVLGYLGSITWYIRFKVK